MGDGGLRFNLAGFPVSLPLGGILGVLLIAYLWAPNFAGAGGGLPMAAVFAVLLYAAVLVHELAHAWAARAFGFPVHGITLWLLGGYTVYERKLSRPWPELAISVVGPLSTLGVAAVCAAIASVTSGAVGTLAGALAWTNAFLAVLNLLPAAPLDGGGVVKALVWRVTGSEGAGARAAGYAGLLLSVLLVVLTVYWFSAGGDFSLLTLVLAAFIGFGAWQSLQGAKARAALDSLRDVVPNLIRPVLAVNDRVALSEVLAMVREDHAGVVTVDTSGRLLASLSPAAVEAVPASRQDTVAVGPFTAAIPAEQRAVMGSDGTEPVYSLAESRLPFVFVTDEDGRPLGVLMASDVNAALDDH